VTGCSEITLGVETELSLVSYFYARVSQNIVRNRGGVQYRGVSNYSTIIVSMCHCLVKLYTVYTVLLRL
jgi:hypothetical protein